MFEFIKRWTGAFLLSAIAVGFLIPQLAILKPALAPFLMLLLFCSFVKLDFSMKKFLRPELALFPIFNWLILPPIVYFATPFLPNELRIGLLLVVITPPALGSPVITSLAKGDLELIVANVTLYNLLAPLSYAFIPTLFLSNENIQIDYLNIFIKVAYFIFTPLILALIIRSNKASKRFILEKVDPLKAPIQIVLIAIAVSTTTSKMKELSYINLSILVAVTFLLAGLLYIIGYVIARKNRLMQKSLPIALGHKNTLLALTIGVASFSELAALPAIFYLIAHHTYNGIIISMGRKE